MGPSDLDLRSSALAVLRAAGETVAAEWIGASQGTHHDARVIARIAESLVAVVSERAGAGGSGGEGVRVAWPPDGADTHLCHRVLREVRVRLLSPWRAEAEPVGEVDPTEVLWVLAHLEQARLDLWISEDGDLAHRFSGPDPFELLVEIGHDIRSPLSSIMFLAETLRRGRSGEVNELQRRQLGLIYSAALGLQSISNDVVDSAAAGRGLTREAPAPFSLSEVFAGIKELVGPVAEEKGLLLDLRLPNHDRFLGHPLPLGRALLNLTTNALKFTESGGVTVGADWAERGSLEFSVQDTGRGMTAPQLELLYEPFRKSEYRTGHFFSGSGLGLSIVRRHLATLGAELFVRSEIGSGTRFWFRLNLPLAPSMQ